MTQSEAELRKQIERIYRGEGRRIFASLVRLVSDFDLAEEVLHEAFAAALVQWSEDGIPAEPRAWLITTAKFKAIDIIRRRGRFEKAVPLLQQSQEWQRDPLEGWDEAHLRDDQLRLIFTCCHPSLAPATQTALTLREICGLTTEEIASAFLTSASTIAQRIVRGKAKIKAAGVPYEVPPLSEIPDRLESVLSVIYLVFNEGYSASGGEILLRTDLTQEAIRLGRLLVDLLPDSEVLGLLALMLLHESRREARCTAEGDIILLEEQDRSQWNRPLIEEGRKLVDQAFATGEVGSYTIQAAISLVHAMARNPGETNWTQIVSLYELLKSAGVSPVVELNWAVAVAMRDGPASGLETIEQLIESGQLADYHLAHAARADMYRRLGKIKSARESYEKALSLCRQLPERRFLEKRILELS